MAAIYAGTGRKPGQLAGTHVTDLAALGLAIWLCQECHPKFNSAAYGYTTDIKMPFVRGNCDGCKTYVPMARLFIKGK